MEPGSQIVGVVARLEPEKGHPTLLEAWPAVLRAAPDAYLLIVGEGSRRDALEAQARDLRIAHRVVFTGRRDDVPAVTAALDVAVLPSYREAQGLSILEAMALSRPVVASNVGGIPEMITDGENGLLVPPHDPEALAAAIVRLLRDHPFADTLGPGRPRHGPRPLLHRADGRRRCSRSTRKAPALCARSPRGGRRSLTRAYGPDRPRPRQQTVAWPPSQLPQKGCRVLVLPATLALRGPPGHLQTTDLALISSAGGTRPGGTTIARGTRAAAPRYVRTERDRAL